MLVGRWETVHFIAVESEIQGVCYTGADPGRKESLYLKGHRWGQLPCDPFSGTHSQEIPCMVECFAVTILKF